MESRTPLQCLPPLTSKQLKSPTNLLRDRNMDDAETPTLSEIFATSVTDGAVTGFTMAQLHKPDKPVLWIQDRLSRREAGRPCLAGLPHPIEMIYVDVSKPVDALWAMEEGLRCTGLSAVIAEVWGDPAVLDFTATKRLALRAEARGLPAYLIRRSATANLSAARLRWRVSGLPSTHNQYDNRAPGKPLWSADLFRARWRTPGQWVASHDDDGLQLAHDVVTQTPEDAALHTGLLRQTR